MSAYLQKHLGIGTTAEVSVAYRIQLDKFAERLTEQTGAKYFGYFVDPGNDTMGLLTDLKDWYQIPYPDFNRMDFNDLVRYLAKDNRPEKVVKVAKKELHLPTAEDSARILEGVNELKTKLMTTEELKTALDTDLKVAMKAKDAQKLGAIRMIKAAITTVEKADPSAPVDWMKILQTEAKKRQQAADEFTKGGAADRAANELYEKNLIETFLPQKMSEEQTTVALVAIKTEQGLTSQKDMGKLIKEFQSRYPGLQDGQTVSRLSKALLA